MSWCVPRRLQTETTPLIHAMEKLFPEAVQVLLSHGANPSVMHPKLDISALFFALDVLKAPGLAKMLIDSGASVTTREAKVRIPPRRHTRFQ